MLDDGDIVLVDHGATGCHLNDDVALAHLQILRLTGTQGGQHIEVVLGIGIEVLGTLVHGRGEPLLVTGLSVLLSQCFELCPTLQGGIDAVSTLLGGLGSLGTNLNLTILY